MGKLKPTQIEEYFSNHLPYRTRIMLAHSRMANWCGDLGQLQACFEASLITGRLYLNFLGITKDRNDQLKCYRFRRDDVSVEDMGGKLIDPLALPPDHRDLFIGFLKMADKAAAHLTMPMKHPWERTHEVIALICDYLELQLYARTGRAFDPNC